MPDNNVTRAEFAKMLCLVFGLEEAAEINYADVDKASWQYAYIAKTDAFTYTADATTYAPDRAATRAEIAYAIVNAAGFETQDAELPFSDVNETNSKLLANAKTAYALDLLKGYPDNTFRPNASVTRAEAVVLLARAEAALAAQKPDEKPPVEEKPSAEDKPSVRIEPMDTLCYIESVTDAVHPTKEEECLRIRFYVSGNETLQVLYVDKNVPVRDAQGNITTLQPGDVICINTNLYGTVKEIYITLRMGSGALLEKPVAGDVFKSMLYVPTAQKWGYLEENKKHEVYLGFFGAMDYDEDEAKIYIYPSDGQKNSDDVRVLIVPGSANVLTYNTNARVKTHYGFETMETVNFYGPATDEFGNLVWESATDTKYYQYVFVKTKDDVITDLLVISNQ